MALDREVLDLVLASGFSTAARVTGLSGRGVVGSAERRTALTVESLLGSRRW